MSWLQKKMNLDNNRLWFSLLLLVIALSFVLSSSLLERCAVLIELVCIWLLAKENSWTFPLGMVSTVLFFFIFWESQLYGSMLLQGYFFAMNIIGWYMWTKGVPSKGKLQTRYLSKKGWIGILAILALLPLGFSWFLQTYTDAQTVYLDSLITVVCMIASILTAYKVLENWYAWIACEFLYLFLYIQHDLFLAVVMSLFTTLLNTQGLLRWRRKMEASQREARLRQKAGNRRQQS